MTSGTRTIDESRTAVSYGTDCDRNAVRFDTIIGRKRTRTWAGGDSPKQPKPTFTYRTFSYPVYKGQTSTVKYYRTRRVRVYAAKVKPKRTENGYTMSLTDVNDTVTTEVVKCPFPTGRTKTEYGSTRGNWNHATSFSSLWGPNDDLALIGKLSDRISGDAFNMLVFLGEGREALQTITHSATRIYKSLKALKKGNLRKASKELVGNQGPGWSKIHPKANGVPGSDSWISQRWLELQYGWKPLLQDIFSAASHFAHMQNRPKELKYRVRGKRRTSKLASSSTSYEVGGDALASKTIVAHVHMIYEDVLLGLTDPRAVAWELMPWSFVVDWFIPIGNYLDAINLNNALNATYVTSTLFKATAYAAYPYPDGVRTYPNGIVFNHTTVQSTRVISSSLPVRLPAVKPWSKIATWQHAANALALLSNLVKPSRAKDGALLGTEGKVLYDDYQRWLESQTPPQPRKD